MTRLTDGKQTIEITMQIWTGPGYSPDWSGDFFGPLPYDEEQEAYIVEDVDYCIEQAADWKSGIGEYNDNPDQEERAVEVTVV